MSSRSSRDAFAEFVPSREIAWDGDGQWCGDGAEVAPRPPLAVAQCSDRPGCGTFVCGRCQRGVPWCFGGEGTLCDDCWSDTRLPRLERLQRVWQRRRELGR